MLSTARRLSLVPERISLAQVERSIDCLVTAEVEALARRIGAFVAPPGDRSLDVQLAAWASIDVVLLARPVAALSTLDTLLTAIDRETDAALAASGGADAADLLNKLQASLNLEAM